MIPMAYLPQAVIAAGILFLLIAAKVLVRQRRILEVVPYSNVTLQLPTKWDDAEITRLLQRHHDQPTVLVHAISSIKTRMIMGQDLKTAQQRLKLIAGVIELFKLNKEMQGILHDIHLAEKDFEIRQVEAQTRHDDAQSKLKTEPRLRELRRQRDELQLQKEITQLESDIGSVKHSHPLEQKQTAEQQRAKERADCEAKIQSLKDQKQAALKLPDEDERVHRVNAIDNAIQREYDRWSKLL